MSFHDFTPYQRGKIDYAIGTSFAHCPATDLFDREQWEQGYIDAADEQQKREVRIAARVQSAVLASLPKNLPVLLPHEIAKGVNSRAKQSR